MVVGDAYFLDRRAGAVGDEGIKAKYGFASSAASEPTPRRADGTDE